MKTASLLSVLVFGGCTAALAASPKGAVDEVSQAAIQSAFRVLQRDYIRREDLTIDQLNRAALQGLLARLDFGAELVRDNGKEEPPSGPLLSESLTTEIAYFRPPALNEPLISALQDKLKTYADRGARHAILDLRTPGPPGEFEQAAALLELFLPRGSLLFKLKQLGSEDVQLMLSRRDPVWRGTLLVLVDEQSNNLGETVAAVLGDQKRALIVGSATKGATVRYESVPLDHGWKLRFARSEVLLPDDSSVFREGLQPDFTVRMDPAAKKEIFGKAQLGTIKPFIFEQARPRFNEAALVSNQNPDLDDYIRSSRGESMANDEPGPRDAVVQRAMDVLRSSDHFAGMKLNWKVPPAASSKPAGPVPGVLPAQQP